MNEATTTLTRAGPYNIRSMWRCISAVPRSAGNRARIDWNQLTVANAAETCLNLPARASTAATEFELAQKSSSGWVQWVILESRCGCTTILRIVPSFWKAGVASRLRQLDDGA
jgi:hypothetical protein